MENKRKIPPAMNIYHEGCELLLQLNEDEAGRVIQSAIIYFLEGTEPPELSKLEQIIFTQIKGGLDYSFRKYEDLCRKKQEAANKRWGNEE